MSSVHLLHSQVTQYAKSNEMRLHDRALVGPGQRTSHSRMSLKDSSLATGAEAGVGVGRQLIQMQRGIRLELDHGPDFARTPESQQRLERVYVS